MKRDLAVNISGAGEQASVPIERYRLIVIAVAEAYLDPWQRLKAAVTDAKSVASILVERYGFEIEAELYEADATWGNINKTLRDYAEHSKQTDALVIYFAGHGYLDKLTDSGAWIPADGGGDGLNWLENDTIKKLINVMQSRHVLLLSDSCFSGDFFRSERRALPEITDAYVRKAYSRRGRQAITSGGLEPVVAQSLDGKSPFAYWLCRALEDNVNSHIVPSELFQRIKGGIAENAEQQPQFGRLYGTGGETDGELVFLKKEVKDFSELMAARQAQLSELEYAEAAQHKFKNDKEALEIKLKQFELAQLDQKIAAARRRLHESEGSGEIEDHFLALSTDSESPNHSMDSHAAVSEVVSQEIANEVGNYSDQTKQSTSAGWKLRGLYAGVVIALIAILVFLGKNQHTKRSERLHEENLLRGLNDQLEIMKLTGKDSYESLPSGLAPVRTQGRQEGVDWHLSLPNTGGVLKMVWLNPGSFLMGAPASQWNERWSAHGTYNETQHGVILTNGFWLGKYEVTQAQWEAVMGNNPSHFDGRPEHPVTRVSWKNAMDFCSRLNEIENAAGRLPEGYRYTLPTEAQWEYACRAGTQSKFSFGDEISSWRRYANFRDPRIDYNSAVTLPVGSLAANAWGLHDMHGNVEEWCLDIYGTYPTGIVFDPEGSLTGSTRTMRGGSYRSPIEDYPEWCRSSYRSTGVMKPVGSDYGNLHNALTYGFRLALVKIDDNILTVGDIEVTNHMNNSDAQIHSICNYLNNIKIDMKIYGLLGSKIVIDGVPFQKGDIIDPESGLRFVGFRDREKSVFADKKGSVYSK